MIVLLAIRPTARSRRQPRQFSGLASRHQALPLLDLIRDHNASTFYDIGCSYPKGDYYVLFFLHLRSRRVTLGGITRYPAEAWITQMARNPVDEMSGGMRGCCYVLHDRAKFCAAFDEVLASEGIHCLRLPPRSPNLHAFAERWVRSVKTECLSKLILFGESSLHRALTEFVAHYHSERNHQEKGNSLLFPTPALKTRRRDVLCRQRLGGSSAGIETPTANWLPAGGDQPAAPTRKDVSRTGEMRIPCDKLISP
jgi:hypothetical protein